MNNYLISDRKLLKQLSIRPRCERNLDVQNNLDNQPSDCYIDTNTDPTGYFVNYQKLESIDCLSSSNSEQDQSFSITHRLSSISKRIKCQLEPNSIQKLARNSIKVIDLQKYFKFEDDTQFCQMANIQEENNLIPRFFGGSLLDSDMKTINLANALIGDIHMKALSAQLSGAKFQNVKVLNFTNNNLSSIGLQNFLYNIPHKVKELQLADNKINGKGISLFRPLIELKLIRLKILNLENNQLKDKGTKIVLEVMAKCLTLKVLNLSKNEITDQSAKSIYNHIMQTKSLEILYLHWNLIKGGFGLSIVRAMQRNQVLKVLDLSYNCIGNQSDTECITNWCRLIEMPKLELTHLDLSYNGFTLQELQKLTDSLEKNNSLYGFHIEGNQLGCYMDAKGYLKTSQQLNDVDLKNSVKQRIDGVSYIPRKPSIYEEDNIINCCWICQGWQEVVFQWIPSSSGPMESGPIFLHVDFENFAPQMMDDNQNKNDLKAQKSKSFLRNQIGERLVYETMDKYLTFTDLKKHHLLIKPNKQIFQLKKMCPPERRIYYFFSNPILNIQIAAANQQKIEVQHQITQLKNLEHFEFLDGTKIVFQPLNFINYIDTKQQFVIDDKNDYGPLIAVVPRDKEASYKIQRKNIYMAKGRNMKVLQWRIENSFFKDQIADTESLMEKCCEYDYSLSRIGKFVKNDYDKLKLREYLLSYYQKLKDVYKYYSALSISQGFDVFCMPFPSFLKLIQTTNMIDGQFLKLNDIELDLVSVKNNVDPLITSNRDKALTRYQFIEMIFRIAYDKYSRSGICKSHADSFMRLMKESFDSQLDHYETAQEWRDQRFWNMACDQLIKLKLSYLTKLFEFISEIRDKKWFYRLRWISIKEFSYFLHRLEIYSEFFTEKDAAVVFYQSTTTVVEENSDERIMKMNFTEFIEALGRLAEKLSPAPLGIQYDRITLTQKQILPLHIKMETLLTFIYQKTQIEEKEIYSDYFNHEDARLSMPLIKNIQKFQLSEFFEQSEHDAKDNRSILENLPQIDQKPTNILLINHVGVNFYQNIYKQPYILPHYQAFFEKNEEQEVKISKHKRKGFLKEKAVKSTAKKKKIIQQVQLLEIVKNKVPSRRKIIK